MRKLLFCIPSLENSGGTERILTNKVNYLCKNYGYKIYIVLTESQTKKPFYKLEDSIEIINTNINFEKDYNYNIIFRIFIYLYKIRLYKRKLTEILTDIKPDCTTTLLSHEIDFISKIKDGSKKIGECHFNRNFRIDFVKNTTNNILKKWISYYRNWSIGKKVKKLDCFVCLTENDYNSWKEIKHKMIIPNFISFESSVKSSVQNKTIVCAGRYTKQKGFDLLLQIWTNIEPKHPNWNLYIYGDGIERDNLENYVKSNNLRNVHLEHTVQDVKEKFINASFLVFPSRFEGFGLVIIEAMECGLPVIAFDCNFGPGQIITNNVDGILIKEGNLKSMEESIEKLIISDSERKRLSNQAILKAKKYSIKNIIHKWIEVYK